MDVTAAVPEGTTSKQPLLLRIPAQLISWIFHPLFIPVYVTAFLAFIHPSCYSGYNLQEKRWIILRIAYTMVFLPLVTVLLLKGLKFIQSFYLKTQKDRIIPYIACGIYFFWVYLVFRNQPEIPVLQTSFTFGVFLAVSAALIANIYFKISMHTIGMGGVVGLFLLIVQTNSMLMTVPLAIALMLSGLVASSRLLVSDHSSKEIFAGFFLGLLSQIISGLMFLYA